MSTAGRSLTEPAVLAHAKGRLFPDDEPHTDAVADTQFATERWLGPTTDSWALRNPLSQWLSVSSSQRGTGFWAVERFEPGNRGDSS